MTSLAGLRVGIVTPSLAPVGGTELYVHSLLEVHRVLGIHTTVFTAEHGPETVWAGIRVIPCGDAVSESVNPLRAGTIRAAAGAVGREILESCDLVELHRVAPWALMRHLSGRLPLALYLHTQELTCPAKGRYLPVSRAACLRTPGPGCLGVHAVQRCLSTPDGAQYPPLQRLRAVTFRLDSQDMLNLCDHAVFNSQALADLFSATVGTARRAHILNPPLAVIPPATAARLPKRVLFAGRLHAVKGPEDAIAACAALPDTELVVVGDGPLLPALRASAARPGSRASFAGWMDRHALAAEMSRAACVVVPSRWFEAWGMVGPEAVAQGCHVVAYDSGGIREWCRPPWGTLVPTGNLNALIAATRRALDAAPPEGERADWSRAARELWGADAYRSRYAAILAEVAAGRRPAP
ncbi:MAG: glycosyltransferase family 4 protein [Planctomycetes bacterium]|nr:glycosyltransferase family 4 protein [Planctomycetota bacterium]